MRVSCSSFRRRAVVILACAAPTAACGDQISSPQPLRPGDIRAFVSAEVAAQLTPEGTFPLGPVAPEPYPQITRQQAADIAIAWARTYGKFIRPYLERDHGSRIEFDELSVVSPVWYAAAVYEPVPTTAHPGYRNAFGPHFLMYLGVGDKPVLGVSVAAFGEASIAHDGRLAMPSNSGNEVIAYGVAPGSGYSAPVSPEQAVYIAARASGARAAAVPELVNPHRDYHPYHARWRVTLDRPVTILPRSGQSPRTTRELYVGADGEVTVPAMVQQDSVGNFALTIGGRFGLRRRPERPVLFDPVNLAPG